MISSLLKILFVCFISVIAGVIELLFLPFHRTGNFYHAVARIHSRLVLTVCGVRLEVVGRETIDFTRSYIYVSNHASHFDISVVIAAIPDQIRFVYKKELEKIPFFGWGLKYGKVYIGIDRGKGQDAIDSLEEAAKKIRNGASVILFAEGTRTSDGKLQPFKRGPFNLALRAGVPVIPVTIKGSFQVMSRNSWRVRPGTITVFLDTPIPPPATNGKETELRLRDQVHGIIEQHLSEG